MKKLALCDDTYCYLEANIPKQRRHLK